MAKQRFHSFRSKCCVHLMSTTFRVTFEYKSVYSPAVVALESWNELKVSI